MSQRVSISSDALRDWRDVARLVAAEQIERANAVLSERADCISFAGVRSVLLEAGLTASAVGPLLRFVVGLRATARGDDAEAAELLLSVIEAGRSDPEFDTKRAGALHKPLLAMIGGRCIHVLAAALDLQTEHTNLFTDVKCIVDARPVFVGNGGSGGKSADQPAAFLITHTLRLYFSRERREREVAVVMTEADIRRLREACDHALALAGRTARAFEEKQIPVLRVGEEEGDD